MANVSLGSHFEDFIQKQVQNGRFQNASEVVRAGLRLLEDHEASHAERLQVLKQEINASFDDPRPDIPADEVFDRLERRAQTELKAGQRGA